MQKPSLLNSRRSRAHRGLRRLARLPATGIISVYVVLNAVFSPLFGPLVRALLRMRLFAWLAQGIARLPPYAVLVALLVPLVIFEPPKVLALYWLATGHVMRGVVALVLSYAGSLLLVERVFAAGHDKLMSIGWFAALVGFALAIRDPILVWIRTRPLFVEIKAWVAERRQMLARLWRSKFGHRMRRRG